MGGKYFEKFEWDVEKLPSPLRGLKGVPRGRRTRWSRGYIGRDIPT